jgi:hypothetical protein
MFRVAEKQRDCVFSLRFVLRKNNDVWNNLFMALRLVKKGKRDAIDYDYGEYVLGERFLSIEEGLNVCSNLFLGEIATSEDHRIRGISTAVSWADNLRGQQTQVRLGKE